MVRIPVESEEDRVVRPPRQKCHRKSSGANRFNQHNRYDRLRAEDLEKCAAASREGTSDGRSTVRFRSTTNFNEWKGKKEATPKDGKVYLAISPGRGDLKPGEKSLPFPKELVGRSYDDPVVMKAYLS